MKEIIYYSRHPSSSSTEKHIYHRVTQYYGYRYNHKGKEQKEILSDKFLTQREAVQSALYIASREATRHLEWAKSFEEQMSTLKAELSKLPME